MGLSIGGSGEDLFSLRDCTQDPSSVQLRVMTMVETMSQIMDGGVDRFTTGTQEKIGSAGRIAYALSGAAFGGPQLLVSLRRALRCLWSGPS